MTAATSGGTTDERDAAEAVETLESAAADLDRLEPTVAEHGEERLDRVAGACESVDRLFERYEDRATTYDDFEGFVEFQDAFVELVERLPEDLPARGAFEEADDIFQRSRLKEVHFERAREALEPARELADAYEAYREARDRYARARHDVEAARSAVADRIDECWRVLALGRADLDADVSALEGAVRRYNEAVREAFTAFRRAASAREVFDLVETAAEYPLVEWRTPPGRLADYVASAEVGAEPIPTLLEYADYSVSKLDHYVEAPHELKRHVATNRTYLSNLDASPLAVEWPPPPASKLRYRTREYLRVVNRFADDDVVAALRTVRGLARDGDRYGRLREAAHAREALTDEQLARLERDAVTAELERLQAERDRLDRALAEHPPVDER